MSLSLLGQSGYQGSLNSGSLQDGARGEARWYPWLGTNASSDSIASVWLGVCTAINYLLRGNRGNTGFLSACWRSITIYIGNHDSNFSRLHIVCHAVSAICFNSGCKVSDFEHPSKSSLQVSHFFLLKSFFITSSKVASFTHQCRNSFPRMRIQAVAAGR